MAGMAEQSVSRERHRLTKRGTVPLKKIHIGSPWELQHMVT